MLSLGLIGKEYKDTILSSPSFIEGETNICSSYLKRKGGIYNFPNLKFPSLKFKIYANGSRDAFIINNTKLSKRTSFTVLKKESKISKLEINDINKKCNWIHVSYIDDIEDYQELFNLSIPMSLDFCTTQPREKYLKLIKKSSLIFDSRERKGLYSKISINNPLILHDEKGCELIINKNIAQKGFTKPKKNLNVNGAGDIFAGIFINNYYNLNIEHAIRTTPESVTNALFNVK
jgi:hypothetical protein